MSKVRIIACDNTMRGIARNFVILNYVPIANPDFNFVYMFQLVAINFSHIPFHLLWLASYHERHQGTFDGFLSFKRRLDLMSFMTTLGVV